MFPILKKKERLIDKSCLGLPDEQEAVLEVRIPLMLYMYIWTLVYINMHPVTKQTGGLLFWFYATFVINSNMYVT